MLPSKVKIYSKKVDLRKGQLGLVSLLEDELSENSQEEILYIFINSSKNLMKGVYWDRTGYCILSKRLLSGRFSLPLGESMVEIEKKDLRYFMDGLKLF